MSDDPIIYNSRLKLTRLQGVECVEVDGQPMLAGDELVTTQEATFFDDGEVKTTRVLGRTVNPAPQPGVTAPLAEGKDTP